MNEDGFKEVYFDAHCPTCESRDVKEVEEPCDSCLSEPINLYTHRPVNYVENEKLKKARA